MSRTAVEQVIGKLLIDAEFRKAAAANPAEALAAFDLTTEEREALTQIDAARVEAAAGELEQRVSKVLIHLPVAQG